MTVTLHPSTRDRLVKLLGMLGSDYAGERAAAALKASDLLRQCGLSWPDVVALTPRPAATARAAAAPAGGRPAQSALWALEQPELLTEWERRFLHSIARRATLTAKQHASLQAIVARLQTAQPQQQRGAR